MHNRDKTRIRSTLLIKRRFNVLRLLDTDWRDRVLMIEFITSFTKYPVKFWQVELDLWQSMPKLPAGSIKIRKPNPDQIKGIAHKLGIMHDHYLVHGDVHAKNIWHDGSQAVLLDYEPSLLQLQGERSCLMGTAPRIHPSDRQSMQLSTLTDRMGFVCWATGLSARIGGEVAQDITCWDHLSKFCAANSRSD
jgi:hypothetical protein